MTLDLEQQILMKMLMLLQELALASELALTLLQGALKSVALTLLQLLVALIQELLVALALEESPVLALDLLDMALQALVVKRHILAV